MISKSISMIMFSVMLLLFTFVSCKESPSENTTLFQTTRVYRTHNHLVSPSELAIVQALFKKNNLSLSNLQVYRLKVNSEGYFTVECHQFQNGLELFYEDAVFFFDNQTNLRVIHDLVTQVDVPWEPMISEKDAGELFYKVILNDSSYRERLESFDNQGYYAQLGYYNLNRDQLHTTDHFVLAWKLNVADGSEYPFAYIRADTLSLIRYSNGIIW